MRLVASWTCKYRQSFQQRPRCVTHVTDDDTRADLVKTDKSAAPIGFVTHVTQMTQVFILLEVERRQQEPGSRPPGSAQTELPSVFVICVTCVTLSTRPTPLVQLDW